MDSKGNVLVVDDDPMLCTGVERILTKRGYTVASVSNVEAALARLSRAFFDLVLTDLQMPGQDGMALLREIKDRWPHLPVVMFTGHGSMDVVIEALRYGVNDFLNKPFKPEELLNIVEREVIRYQQSLPPGVEESVSLQLEADALDEIDRLLINLRVEINARCVLLIEGNGSVIAAKGAIEDLNISALGALVAGDFAATAGIASLIGENAAFQLNFHEGELYSVYSGQVLPGVFLLVIFGQDVRLGAVLYYTKDTLTKLKPIMDEAVIQPIGRSSESSTSVAATPSPVEGAVTDQPPTDLKPPASDQPPAPDQPAELFSFEDILNSGMLDDEALGALEEQFDNLWNPD